MKSVKHDNGYARDEWAKRESCEKNGGGAKWEWCENGHARDWSHLGNVGVKLGVCSQLNTRFSRARLFSHVLFLRFVHFVYSSALIIAVLIS